MKMQTIQQEIIFAAPAHKVYELLMDEKLHAEFTESDVSINTNIGGVFSIYDGYIAGKNIELIKNKKIVQLWRAEEPEWPEHHFSEVIFNFSDHKNFETLLTFEHRYVPEAVAKSIENGWVKYYWEPMKAWIANH
ncbi:MAG: SRPBCC domain-containing protein [Bacteroidia bacterium]|jgi:activator of HSP90 ATPase|nr:SRPBCC domain-containing protein [Bacteroidia bacterium]